MGIFEDQLAAVGRKLDDSVDAAKSGLSAAANDGGRRTLGTWWSSGQRWWMLQDGPRRRVISLSALAGVLIVILLSLLSLTGEAPPKPLTEQEQAAVKQINGIMAAAAEAKKAAPRPVPPKGAPKAQPQARRAPQ